MKALTLHRPWPYAILHLGKRIENRSHDQFKRYRGPLLLHAGKGWQDNIATPAGVAWDDPLILRTKSAHPTGIVGRCRVVAAIEACHYCDGTGMGSRYTRQPCGSPHCIRGAVFLDDDLNPVLEGHVSELLGVIEDHVDLRWWMDGHGLVLADVEALDEPIPCKGSQGLWTPPEEVLERLPEGWAA